MIRMTTVLGLLVSGLLLVACNTAPRAELDREYLVARAARTIDTFKATDSAIEKKFFNSAVGYAVFPGVGKGGAGLGGAYGRGVLYEDDRPIGYCSLSQGSVGLQLGGQSYSEIIFFQTDKALNQFKSNTFAFAAQASAVAAEANASVNAAYEGGVAVFTLAGKGLMGEASIGGQKFKFVPMYQAEK